MCGNHNDALCNYRIYNNNKRPKEMNEEAFNKMMGYAMGTVNELVEKAKEINRNRIIELNERDLKDNGIEQD